MLSVVPGKKHADTPTPTYGRGEQIADRCIHYAGLVAALIGSVVLIVAAAERERALTIVSVAIYGVGLLGMIGASALYNLAARRAARNCSAASITPPSS